MGPSPCQARFIETGLQLCVKEGHAYPHGYADVVFQPGLHLKQAFAAKPGPPLLDGFLWKLHADCLVVSTTTTAPSM